jgi:class 3 adenylate cyclase/tetratricopeptide (TPR) repeat protein
VLFADIVGFTGLSESRDPEQIKNLVDRCFARLADDITSFGGRVDKVVGDGIVALFGAPVAHEDDAERAVRAALRMQESVIRFDGESSAGIRMRIGINTGEVLVGGLVAGDDYTAIGDVVNVASRLQAAAEPGSVLVGSETHAETCAAMRYGPEGHAHVRGRDEPVPTWRAIEPIGRPGERHDDAPTPLVGRDPEMALLRRATASAFRRQRAHLLLLQGETGVGKSRLAGELADLARIENDAMVLSGRCLPYGEANIWWPIAEAIRGLIGIEADDDSDGVRPLVADAVAGLFEADDDRVGPMVEGVLGMLGHPSRLDELDPARGDEESARAVRALLYRLAARQPLLLSLADLHWADDAVLRFVDDTLNRLDRRPFVILATGRPDLSHRWTYGPGRYNTVSVVLEPLDEESAELLLSDLLGPGADPDVRRAVLDRAGGNPLFLHEMSRMVPDGPDGVVVPSNIRSVVGARLDGLDEPARVLLEDASSFGLSGIVPALEQMALEVRGDDDISGALERLGADGLLQLRDGRWAFRSSLVREVAYSRMTKAERAWRHAGIGAAIEARTAKLPDTVAHHYRTAAALDRELGGIAGVPEELADRALEWTLRAARAMSGAGANERIRTLYSEALDLLDDDDPRRATLLLERARGELTELRLGAAKRDIAAAGPLVENAADVRLDVALALVESELAQWDSDFDRALERSEVALKLVDELDDQTLAGEALRRCGMVQLFLGRESDAESLISAAYDAYEAGRDIKGMAWARQNLAWISFIRGRLVEAEERLGEAVRAFEDLGDIAGIAWSRGLLAYVRIYEGRFTEADELATRSLLDAQERGDKWGEGMMIVALGTTALWIGRIDEAVERGHVATALFKNGNDPLGTIQSTALLGRALTRSGRVAEGLQLLRDARVGDPDEHGTAELLYTAGMAAAATVGDVDEGRRFGAGRGHPIVDPTVLGHSDQAVAGALTALQDGDLENAVETLDRLPGVDDPSGSTWGWAVSALAAAAMDIDPGSFIEAVAGSIRATYGDRVLTRLADACWRARAGDDIATRTALAQADTAVPSGGDRIHPFIVAAARAECLERLGAADAGAARTQADALAAEMGIDGVGWRTAFTTIVSLPSP